ncbi:MAG TPA: aldo/keto reductase, partial [Candidatus Paenibacillus intestinavium]|nr:aldo/keto reductase [Candidatus Paenibacillus intestinavium]
ETFAGLPLAKGQELSRELGWIAEGKVNMTRAALRWILDHEAVSTVIPGFKNSQQVLDNLGALDVPSFSQDEMSRLEQWYKDNVHEHIRGSY